MLVLTMALGCLLLALLGMALELLLDNYRAAGALRARMDSSERLENLADRALRGMLEEALRAKASDQNN